MMGMLNRRRHERKYVVKATECVLNQHPIQNETFDCIVADISTSGVCLLTTKPIPISQEVTLINHIFPSNRTGIVRWSEEYKGLYYRSGLEFN
jgi:hypothetical protein